MDIPLSSKHGIGATITRCPVCGGTTDEIALAGNSVRVKCRGCNAMLVKYVGKPVKPCPNCNGKAYDKVGDFDPDKHTLLSSTPCKKCLEVLNRTNIMVCTKCGMMSEFNAHRVLKEFMSKRPLQDMSNEERDDLIKQGILEEVKGTVRRVEACSACTSGIPDRFIIRQG